MIVAMCARQSMLYDYCNQAVGDMDAGMEVLAEEIPE
jgi:hypothetical protein